MLERCQHEHIVRLLGTFQGPRDLVLALEFVPGGDIQMLLQRHGALAEPAVGAIIRQLSLALQHVHSLKLLHRDVKLENLVVVRPGSAPVIKVRRRRRRRARAPAGVREPARPPAQSPS